MATDMNKMNVPLRVLIVHINIPFPSYSGADVRVFDSLKNMSKKHRVSFLCLADIKSIENVRYIKPYCENVWVLPVVTDRSYIKKSGLIFCPKEWPRLFSRTILIFRRTPYIITKYYHPKFRLLIRNILENEKFDVIQFELLGMGQYISYIQPFIGSAKKILVDHGLLGLETKRKSKYAKWLKKIYYNIESELEIRYEKKLISKFDHLIVVSEEDKDRLVGYGRKESQISIIRSGIDIEKFKYHEISSQENQLIFLGGMDFIPNKDGLVWFLERIFPIIINKLNNVKLLVIGRADSIFIKKYQNRNVIFYGRIDDLNTEMGNGRIFIAPIRIGAGTRLKIVTAMAFGMPIVSTSIGIEGIPARESDGVIIKDKEEEFALSVLSLFENRETRFEYGRRARRFVERQFSSKLILNDLSEIYIRLVNSQEYR